MRTPLGLLFGLVLMTSAGLFSQSPSGVQKVDGHKDLFVTGEIYIGGQPTLEMLRWLKEQGVGTVINLRTENENKDFAALAYNEAVVLKDLGLNYTSIPMEKGAPKQVEALAECLKTPKGKVLLHCASGGRATNLWMAYLVSHRGLTVDAALAIGRQMKFSFPLEDLLGGRMSMKVVPGDPAATVPVGK